MEEETIRKTEELKNFEGHDTPREILRRLKGYYRCKDTDFDIYNDLKEKYLRQITPTKMKELIHELDTQKNESMNTLVSYHIHKNRNLSRSNEIFTRLAYIVGMNNVGKKEMVARILERCEISTDNVSLLAHLDIEDNSKKRKSERENSSRQVLLIR